MKGFRFLDEPDQRGKCTRCQELVVCDQRLGRLDNMLFELYGSDK